MGPDSDGRIKREYGIIDITSNSTNMKRPVEEHGDRKTYPAKNQIFI